MFGYLKYGSYIYHIEIKNKGYAKDIQSRGLC